MENDFILVLDLGGPQAVTMARKLRNLNYYTEILSRTADIELLHRKAPRGILVVGGDSRDDADAFPRAVLALGIPVLALGGAARLMALVIGSEPEGTLLVEQATQISFQSCELFDTLGDSDRYFERIDGFRLPEGYASIASTLDGLDPAFGNFEHNLYGLQFYPESNDPDGAIILSNFAEKICGCTPFWSVENYLDIEIKYIREKIGDGKALMAISGGIDSSACALLMKRAIGDRLKCVFVDNGLLRDGEAQLVTDTFRNELDFNVICIDAGDRFINRLKGITDPMEKHRAVHNEFINVLSEVSHQLGDVEFLVEGTIYSDLLTDTLADEAYERRYNSGTLIEPIRMLFKDEVRKLGEMLGLPAQLINRQPFPGPALAVRCTGEVTPEKLNLIRKADRIFTEEILLSGQDKKLDMYFAVLTDTRTLGVRNGTGCYEYACVLRAVSQKGTTFSVGRLPSDLLERVAERITHEVPGINRVVYDITGSNHSEIEWE
ncbi:MAG: GMP synthase (glutamine-hydrolyzing) [Clostridia bacterium]|nr:GMP synthase (glutamine-hydrolyzing) [Clostridia bacterium]